MQWSKSASCACKVKLVIISPRKLQNSQTIHILNTPGFRYVYVCSNVTRTALVTYDPFSQLSNTSRKPWKREKFMGGRANHIIKQLQCPLPGVPIVSFAPTAMRGFTTTGALGHVSKAARTRDEEQGTRGTEESGRLVQRKKFYLIGISSTYQTR